MNKAQMSAFWDHFRTVQGITVRAIEAIPADKVDARPCKDMRSPRELIVHMYNMMRYVADGAAKGNVGYIDSKDDPVTLETVKSHADLVRYARESWDAADRAVGSMGDAQLQAMVPTQWGMAFPGAVCITIIYDEHLHHRGQLYAYLRQLGVEPPFMWDFEHNAPQYRPKQVQQA
jgi:uncharacterized damage-inducible protein DinB